MSLVYYNEYDKFAAAWLRKLIDAGHIPKGDVDERSIVDVRADDLRAYRQCHFFAGIGGWSHALRLAGWPDDREIWTGSCPCQPFSVAGKGKGKSDERHLWPVFFQLISECRPPVVMGEQVAGKAGYDWFDGVRSDLAGEDYSGRAVDIPACAVNAPHIRQRLYWVATNMAQPNRDGHDGKVGNEAIKSGDGSNDGLSIRGDSDLRRSVGNSNALRELQSQGAVCDEWGWIGDAGAGDMVKADCAGQREHGRAVAVPSQQPSAQCAGGDALNMADAKSSRWGQRLKDTGGVPERNRAQGEAGRFAKHSRSFWHDTEWLTGADGKTRRAKPGVRLLAHGLPNRVGRLRGYGNAIVPPLAAEVIKAFMEVAP